MLVTNDSPTWFVDVDSTLVFTEAESPYGSGDAELVWFRGREFHVHWQNRELVLDAAARGHVIIVWSAGGAQWASTVVAALGLTSAVTACLSKPAWYLDDKHCREWLTDEKLTYIKP